MNLLVIVTLLISIIAIYAQVLGLQTARMFGHQTGIAQAMITWHGAAVSMASNIIKTNNAAYGGVTCSLSWNPIPAPVAINRCPAPILFSGLTDTAGTVTNAGNAPNLIAAGGVNQCVHIPATCTPVGGGGCSACTANYDTVNYQFYSILFQTGGQNYVATIVPAPVVSAANPGPGYISLAGGNQIALTAGDLMQQLQRTTTTNASFGYVNAAYQLTTTIMQLTLPGFNNANGAIAIVSSGL